MRATLARVPLLACPAVSSEAVSCLFSDSKQPCLKKVAVRALLDKPAVAPGENHPVVHEADVEEPRRWPLRSSTSSDVVFPIRSARINQF